VPSLAVDVNSWARLACYPQGSFYPVSYGHSTLSRRITKSDFRLCSARWPCSQAGLCLCTLGLVSIQPEPTFERLRYLLGGDRPSQTAHLPLSPVFHQVRAKVTPGWYFTGGSTEASAPASLPPSYPTQVQP
jgi:hypothetical protein